MLRITLFGGLQLSLDGTSAVTLPTRSVELLLAYLLLHRERSHSREVLAGTFWGEASEERARGSLSTALWRLRGVLEPRGTPRSTYLLLARNGELSFNSASDYWLDVEAFERAGGQHLHLPIEALRPEYIRDLEQGIDLYASELLPGVYADWALRERERLRFLLLKMLTRVMAYYALNGAYDQALAAGRRILSHDPLREEIHREMMRLYARAGQRALALRQYENCCSVLRAELGIGPMVETRTLCSDLLAGAHADAATDRLETLELGPAPAAGSTSLWETVRAAARQLSVALRGIEEATAQLEQVHRQLEEADRRPAAGVRAAARPPDMAPRRPSRGARVRPT